MLTKNRDFKGISFANCQFNSQTLQKKHTKINSNSPQTAPLAISTLHAPLGRSFVIRSRSKINVLFRAYLTCPKHSHKSSHLARIEPNLSQLCRSLSTKPSYHSLPARIIKCSFWRIEEQNHRAGMRRLARRLHPARGSILTSTVFGVSAQSLQQLLVHNPHACWQVWADSIKGCCFKTEQKGLSIWEWFPFHRQQRLSTTCARGSPPEGK